MTLDPDHVHLSGPLAEPGTHQHSGWHRHPAAPQDDREAEIERIAAVLHGNGRSINVPGTDYVRPVMCRVSSLDECARRPDHEANAAALYDAGLRSPPAPESPEPLP